MYEDLRAAVRSEMCAIRCRIDRCLEQVENLQKAADEKRAGTTGGDQN